MKSPLPLDLDEARELQVTKRVAQALQGLKDALAIDHYAMEVSNLGKHHLLINIRAEEGACDECLIPPDMITELVRTQIPSDLCQCRIDISIDRPNLPQTMI